MTDEELIEAIAKVLDDEDARPGHSIHSWQCEHPDRYGECDCAGGTAALILAAIKPQIAADAIKMHQERRAT